METIHRKTSRKTQVPMGRRCQERPEEDETHKMDRTSPRSPQMERKEIVEKAKILPEL